MVAKECMATKVCMLMIELSMHKVIWEVGEAPLAQFAMVYCCRGPGDLTVPQWDHEYDI